MVATDDEVMSWVEEQLKSRPDVTVDELFEGAKEMNPEIGELNKRQFHARYPLQVKRRAQRAAAAEAAGEEEPKAPPRKKAKTDPAVMEWVKAQLEVDPQVTVDTLLTGALELNPGIGELTKRQFHARYPLQVKRAAKRAADAAAGIVRKPRRRRRPTPPPPEAEVSADAPGAAVEPEVEAVPEAEAPPAAAEAAPVQKVEVPVEPAPAPAVPGRDVIRRVLFTFATDLVAAKGKRGVVAVLASVDDYIDQMG